MRKEDLLPADKWCSLWSPRLVALSKAVTPRPSKLVLEKGVETKRKMMSLLGYVAATNYDCFLVTSRDRSKEVEVKLPALLEKYFPNPEEQKKIRQKFTQVETRNLQVGEETLEMFSRAKCDIAAKLLALRAKEKLLTTYYDSHHTGMIALVHQHDSKIHHELSHNRTATGRLACANPNCQNIPKDEGEGGMRQLFASRFGPEGWCIEADYSQLEVVTLCALSRDKNMTHDIKTGVDFHCKRVTMMRPELTYEEVYRRAKKDKEPEFVELRQKAKAFSFSRQYGAGVKSLSERTGLSEDAIRKLIEAEKETYKECDAFYEMVSLAAHSFVPIPARRHSQ